MSGRLDFALPPGLKANEPPEARGLGRDGVRMLVAYRAAGRLVPTTFSCLGEFLTPDDLVVVNTSATLPAAVDATDPRSGRHVVVHLSSRLSSGPTGEELWAVEPRRPVGPTTKPWADERAAAAGLVQGEVDSPRRDSPSGDGPPWDGPPWDGRPWDGRPWDGRPWDGPREDRLKGDGLTGDGRAASLPEVLSLGARDDAQLRLLRPYRGSHRLWTAVLSTPGPVLEWLYANGRPVRYAYVDRPWPLSAYQNVYATEAGSAEMPSAGRPFTPELITRLVAQGVAIAPLVLHTGVASLEAEEAPYPEAVTVPPSTARRVNATKRAGGRVVAVGTTVVRALESALDAGTGEVQPLGGWTELVITPDRGVRVVDGLLTGWHEPQASHLLMLEAIAGRDLLESSYATAVEQGYLWHEFGDVALFLP